MESSAPTTEEFIAHMDQAGEHVLDIQPAMASVFNAVHVILNPLRSQADKATTVNALKTITIESADSLINKVKTSTEHLAKEGIKVIQNKRAILTYSFSAAVAALLKKAKTVGLSFRVIVAESRPMYEGRLLSENLASSGIPCTFIIDGAISTWIREADLVLVGADRVSEHSVVNKIGTRALALMARDLHLPIYCACETIKFLHSGFLPFQQRDMPAAEVWEDPPDMVSVRNIYFEEIPLEYFTGCITESGILSVQEIIQRITSHSDDPAH